MIPGNGASAVTGTYGCDRPPKSASGSHKRRDEAAKTFDHDQYGYGIFRSDEHHHERTGRQ